MIRKLLAIIVLLAVVVVPSPYSVSARQWPTEEWLISTPEAQGVDSGILADMVAVIRDEQPANIHSVIVIRHGQIVAEAYSYPYSPDILHDQRSVTKSNIGTLIGIAINEGAIQGVDQPLLSFFPDRTIANVDAQKEAITLEHMLSMSSGIDGSDNKLFDMVFSSDWVQHMLDRPMLYEPGAEFIYSSGGSHVLSALLQNATGQSAEAYAREKLYGPLGITDFRWDTDPNGINQGGFGLWMRPRDMAKLGYLYLHNGEWDGRQIVPTAWIAAATHAHGPNPNYGYQWWLNQDAQPYTMFNAAGYAGQIINVIPDLDMVVVFTSGLKNDEILWRLMNQYIIPAAKSDEPLSENPEEQARLTTEIDTLAHPAPGPVSALPEIAAMVSGKTYAFDFETFYSGWMSFHWDEAALSFEENVSEAVFTITTEGVSIPFTIGLDGVVRLTEIPGTTMAMRGKWQDDNKFVITLYVNGLPEYWNIVVTFTEAGNKMKLAFIEQISFQVVSMTGTLIE